jgi:23S rRNA (adenine2503-C2)-methyltransferase
VLRLGKEHVGVQNRRFEVILDDGSRVEAVLYREDTLCVSSQVGCAVGCPFCASGAFGLSRPLAFEELRDQVLAVRGAGHAVRRATVSGVGEPLHAASSVEGFIAWCRGEKIKPSLTTSGGPTRHLRRFLEEVPHNGLTISVHAGTEETRARLVPKAPSLSQLFAAIAESLPSMSNNRRKKTALAYLLLAGDNDGDTEVDAFADRTEPLDLPIHLFAFNPIPTSDRKPTSRGRYEAVYGRLIARGLRVRMSSQARVEANGGCGTLVAVRRSRDPETVAGRF